MANLLEKGTPEQLLLWGSSYTLKKSRKTKHVHLQLSEYNTLEIIVPVGFNPKYLPKIFQEKRRWLKKYLPNFQDGRNLQVASGNTQFTLPTHISLKAVDEIWHVSYESLINKKSTRLMMSYQKLTLIGNTEDKNECLMLLKKWLKRKGKQHLLSWLNRLSQQTNLAYKGVTVRGQKSLWGSCTINNHINLNYKLLFLPPELVNHLIIHELCHTKHHNHSKSFWKLVEKYDPTYHPNHKQLNQANKLVPTWAI